MAGVFVWVAKRWFSGISTLESPTTAAEGRLWWEEWELIVSQCVPCSAQALCPMTPGASSAFKFQAHHPWEPDGASETQREEKRESVSEGYDVTELHRALENNKGETRGTDKLLVGYKLVPAVSAIPNPLPRYEGTHRLRQGEKVWEQAVLPLFGESTKVGLAAFKVGLTGEPS